MESEERPTKMRKLSHDGTGAQLDGANDVGSSDLSKPLNGHTKPSLEAAEAGASDDDESEDDEDEEQNQTFVTETLDGENNVHQLLDAALPSDQIVSSSDKPLSKNAMKKLLKKQEWEAGRDDRKAKRKQKNVERRVRKREARKDQQTKQGEGEEGVPKQKRRQAGVRLPVTFMIDCGYDELMLEKERISLGSQLIRAYSDNSKAPFQGHLIISSWGGLLKERFDTILQKHHQGWKGVKFVEEGFVAASALAEDWMTAKNGGKMAGMFAKYAESNSRQEEGKEQIILDPPASVAAASQPQHPELAPPVEASVGHVSETPQSATATTPQAAQKEVNDSSGNNNSEATLPNKVIYLTSDSPHTLSSLLPHHTYIIGGLVDKNRHKGICFRAAAAAGISTAKLPISQHMEMSSRFVLATNHVVEIMLRWLECGDWGKAFMQVIPKRKGGRLKGEVEGQEEQKGQNGADSEQDDGSDGE